MFGGYAHGLREIGMNAQHKVIAVNRHKEFRPHEFDHKLEVLGFGVAARGDIHHLIMEDARALPINDILHILNRAFIARNCRRRKYYRISLLKPDKTVFALNDAHKSRARFSLRAGYDEEKSMVRIAMRFFYVNKSVFLNFDVAEFTGERRVIAHGKSVNHHFSGEFFGKPDKLLDARDKRGKSSGNNT